MRISSSWHLVAGLLKYTSLAGIACSLSSAGCDCYNLIEWVVFVALSWEMVVGREYIVNSRCAVLQCRLFFFFFCMLFVWDLIEDGKSYLQKPLLLSSDDKVYKRCVGFWANFPI